MIKTEISPIGCRHIEMTAAEQSKIAFYDSEKTVIRNIKNINRECKSALEKSDAVAIRCVKAGVVFPADWKTYVTSLRAIVNGGAGPLPAQPAYPVGT